MNVRFFVVGSTKQNAARPFVASSLTPNEVLGPSNIEGSKSFRANLVKIDIKVLDEA